METTADFYYNKNCSNIPVLTEHKYVKLCYSLYNKNIYKYLYSNYIKRNV